MLNYFTFICVTANGCCSTSAGIGNCVARPRPGRARWRHETIGAPPRAARRRRAEPEARRRSRIHMRIQEMR